MLKAGMNEVRDVLGISFVFELCELFLEGCHRRLHSQPSFGHRLAAQCPEIGVESFDHFILLSY